jgi:hypothetical protein
MARKRERDIEGGGAASDAYTGMLIVSLLATLTGLLFVFLDYNQYPGKAPPRVQQFSPPPAAQPPQQQ